MFDDLKYDSDGTKYGKQEFDPEGNLLNDETYFGNLVLRNGRPFRILHDDGYVNLLENGLVGELNFHIKDHLGNVRCVLSETPDRQPIIIQASGYFPFGMLFQSEQMQTSASANANKYLYNGKEVQDMPGKWYDYGARFYDAGLGRWFVVDAMAEKYFNFSPFQYAVNNPVLFIDPDGYDIVIWYKEDNKQKSYTFTGASNHNIPNNKFIGNVIQAWNYNVENGGGDKLFEAATNSDITINVVETNGRTTSSQNNIYWNPNRGLKSDNGVVTSPATALEHETDHGVQYLTNPEQMEKDISTYDKDYNNKEEKRVITGSEQKTARANGEIKAGEVTRTNHGGKAVITKGVTSTKIDRKATQKQRIKEENDKYEWSSEWK